MHRSVMLRFASRSTRSGASCHGSDWRAQYIGWWPQRGNAAATAPSPQVDKERDEGT
ncbi:hypothetical protein F8271_10010 [Micromonospora sp. ALFpr18c]|nr:hypothetical protein F8271_10010 [Micromonospora sp. ALFpr18c]